MELVEFVVVIVEVDRKSPVAEIETVSALFATFRHAKKLVPDAGIARRLTPDVCRKEYLPEKTSPLSKPEKVKLPGEAKFPPLIVPLTPIPPPLSRTKAPVERLEESVESDILIGLLYVSPEDIES